MKTSGFDTEVTVGLDDTSVGGLVKTKSAGKRFERTGGEEVEILEEDVFWSWVMYPEQSGHSCVRSSTLTRCSEMLNAREQGACKMAQTREALPCEGEGQQSPSSTAFSVYRVHRCVSHISSLHWHGWCFVGEEKRLSQPFQGSWMGPKIQLTKIE